MADKLRHQKSTRWKTLPATERQKQLMDAAGIDYPADITRGDASALITEHEEDAPHIFSEEALQP